jgi:hypothetical protein
MVLKLLTAAMIVRVGAIMILIMVDCEWHRPTAL